MANETAEQARWAAISSAASSVAGLIFLIVPLITEWAVPYWQTAIVGVALLLLAGGTMLVSIRKRRRRP